MKPSPWNRAALFFLGLPEAADDEPLDRMLGLAEATPLCAISVAGPEAGDAISGLWRRGYQRVEAARRAAEGPDRIRGSREAAYRFASAMGGNLPGFEEATRALYADDRAGFTRQVAAWPADVRDYAMALAWADEQA